jgi:topoisomerase IA-like protein
MYVTDGEIITTQRSGDTVEVITTERARELIDSRWV